MVLLEPDGRCSTLPASSDAVSEMICHWLGSRNDDEDTDDDCEDNEPDM